MIGSGIALDPDLDPGRIEDPTTELKANDSIMIVMHNIQHAARVSDMTAVLG